MEEKRRETLMTEWSGWENEQTQKDRVGVIKRETN